MARSDSKMIMARAHISHLLSLSFQASASGKYPGVPTTVDSVVAESMNVLSKSMTLTSKGLRFRTIFSGFRSL
jgi:hypothetical protein